MKNENQMRIGKALLSSVFCLLSSRLARGASPAARGVLGDRLLPCGVRAARRSAPAVILAFVLALGLAHSAAAMTNNLTYAASLGKFDAAGSVVAYDLTTNVTMTVAIYPSEAATTPYWSRRINADVVSGDFAIVLSDDAGVDPSATEFGALSKYAKLEELFAKVDLDMAYWIGLSHFTLGPDGADGQTGATVPGATGMPARGRIAGAPFALIAERAVEARNSFCIRGAATVATLKATGTVTVEEGAVFVDTVTFNKLATFGSDGLVVTGLVSKTTMDGIGTFKADGMSVSKSASIGDFVVTGGSATLLTPASSGFTAPTSIAVSGTLGLTGPLTVKDRLSADSVESAGTFELSASGILDWDATGGSLSVPDGVYEADSSNTCLKAISTAHNAWISYANDTGTDALVTQIAGAYGGDNAAGTYIGDSGKPWATYGLKGGSAGFFITVLYPLANGDTMNTYNVRTRYVKALTKESSK